MLIKRYKIWEQIFVAQELWTTFIFGMMLGNPSVGAVFVDNDTTGLQD